MMCHWGVMTEATLWYLSHYAFLQSISLDRGVEVRIDLTQQMAEYHIHSICDLDGTLFIHCFHLHFITDSTTVYKCKIKNG